MPWPWGRLESQRDSRFGANRRARRALRARNERSGDGSALLFEPLEPRVLLSATPFGAIAPPQPHPILQDANGTQLFATLSGPGQIQAGQGPGGPTLTVTGTNTNSSLILTVKGGTGHFVLNAIDLAGPISSVTGIGVDLHGKFTAEGPVHVVSLGDVQNSTIIASSSIDSLALGKVQDSTVSVAGSIANFAVSSWLSTGAPNQLNANSIGNLQSAGDFDASLALSGPVGSHGAATLSLANIGGALADGTWYVVGDAGMITARQVAGNWTGDFTKSVSFNSSRDFDGTLATSDLKLFNVGGDLNHAQLLIGADLGPGGRLGDDLWHSAGRRSRRRLGGEQPIDHPRRAAQGGDRAGNEISNCARTNSKCVAESLAV